MSEISSLTCDAVFKRLRDNWDFRQEITAFSRYLKNPSWLIIPSGETGTCSRLGAAMEKGLLDQTLKEDALRGDMKDILDAARRSIRTKQIEPFICRKDIHGLCYPMMKEDEPCGFVVMYGLKKPVSPEIINIFRCFTDTVVRETVKELELEEINKTVRPRAIALSTVHTVHRLMSSTLDMNELLTRIARLSLQVMKVNRCSIKLVDKKCRVLLPMVTVDLRQKKTKLKKVAVGKYAPGKAFKKGVSIRGSDYLATPLVDDDVIGVITLYDKTDGSSFTCFDEEIMKTLAEQSAIAIKNTQLFREQENLTMSSIKCIAQLIETRPHTTHRPEAAFLKLISIIGRKFNMNQIEIKRLQYASMLHDAGQISIPEKVLMKRGGLTGREYEIIKKHPLKGASILSNFKPLKLIVPIILYHHESYNGTGYPKGLKKEEIPLSARILAVVSSFEAMISDKPYRKALSINTAIDEVEKGSGTQFDPKVVAVFLETVSRKDMRKLIERELQKLKSAKRLKHGPRRS
ncbi:MAG: HD domain-containing protein [Candidatus Omnitrophica bacterium]|nr:HD domain-containing protein [Candidatus Omnitrophota bacterium]